MQIKHWAKNAAIPLALLELTGCVTQGTGPQTVVGVAPKAPANAPAGTCWSTTATPATVQTITRQVVVRPATYDLEGNQVSTTQYKTETRQEIIEDRQETFFETPCDDVLTPAFIASLQRALTARGFYAGIQTGVFDPPTRAAIRAFQQPDGIDSGVLSLAAARKLGLVAVAG